MSANEIIAELPRLNRAELEEVGARLNELLGATAGETPGAKAGWGKRLATLAGTVEGLPADFASNHDHYVHGTPKR